MRTHYKKVYKIYANKHYDYRKCKNSGFETKSKTIDLYKKDY